MSDHSEINCTYFLQILVSNAINLTIWLLLFLIRNLGANYTSAVQRSNFLYFLL